MDPMLTGVLIVLASILILSTARFIHGKKKRSRNLPPGSFGWPVVGESLEFLRSSREGTPEKFVAERVSKYKSGVFKTSLMGEAVAVLSGPAGNKFLFSNGNKLVATWWPASVQKLLGVCLTTSAGEEGKQMKKLMSYFVSPAALQQLYIKDMDFVTQQHLQAHWHDGVEALCADLEVDHTDVRILMLAWKMKANRQGYFTQDEWQVGLKALQVDSITKLKKALPKLEAEVMMPANFEDFYAFAFRYCLTEDKQKCLDIESICVLVDLVLGSQFRAQVNSFTEYLKSQGDYKVLNLDQWTNFLRFCQEISFPDLEGYDASQAWPVILDNFVDWVKEKRS